MRALKIVLASLAAVVLLTAAAILFVLWRSIPPLGGTMRLAGLTAPVEITHDALGIPAIRAASDLDAVRALGWLHARDRLFQMEFLRHAAEGRLAEMLGPAAVSSDRFLRSLDLARVAVLSVERMAPEARAMADAYVAGINAWIDERPRGLPAELLVLRHRPEPWTIQQTAAIGRLQAYDLVSTGAELARARAAARIGAARLAELDPVYPEGGAVILPPGAGRWAGRSGQGAGGRSNERTARWARPTALLAADEVPIIPALAEAAIGMATSSRASNSWVIGPARSRSGRPLLANDPHLELRAPSLWYLVAIDAPTLHVAGATIPGIGVVVVGHNRSIAWGLTNVQVDDVDYVIERLSADSSRVLTSDGWVAVETVRDSIRVKGAAAVPYTLRRTPHGPIVSAEAPATRRADSGEVRALAMRWTGHDASDELSALLAVNRAGSWEEFLAALHNFRAPEQNWIFADTAGNIGYATTGAVPVRRSGRGLLPTPGWTDEGRWERFLDFEELPKAFNPPEGFIVTANNRVIGPEYPNAIEAEFALPWRAERIRELITAGGPWSADDVRRMQMDTLDAFARATKGLAAAAAEAAGRSDLAQRLRAWDGTMGADRTEPTLFYTWYRELQRLTYLDELGGGYAPSGPFQAWLRAGASPWFDDHATPEVEDLAALSLRAMRTAIPAADRPWGAVHLTVSEHTMGSVAVLDRLLRLNIPARGRAGSLYTVNVADFGDFAAPFMNTHAASLRMVVDLAAPDDARMIITSGQSGHSRSRHYRDQAAMWWRGELVRVGAGGGAVLRMEP